MAIDFGNTFNDTRYYDIALGSGLALPDADWCVGVWMNLPRGFNTAASFQYLVTGGTIGNRDSFLLFLGEDNNFREIILRAFGAAGDEINQTLVSNVGTAPDGIETTDHLLIMQRRSGNFEWYWVPTGGTVSAPTGSIAQNNTTITPAQWEFGRRPDGNTARYYQNIASELFILTNRSLTSAEVETLAGGAQITSVESSPEAYLRFIEADATVSDLSGNGHNATRNGTGYVNTTHPIPTGVTTSGNIQINDITIAGTGTREIPGTGNLQIGDITVAGTGIREITGTGNLQIGDITISGVGETGSVITATGNLQINDITISGSGLREVTGAGNAQISDIGIAGVGNAFTPITGTGNLQINDITISGAGLREIIGSGNLQIGDITVDGIGNVISVIPSTGNIIINDITVAGSGVREVTGNGNIQIGDIEIAGIGQAGTTIVASGNLQIGDVTISGIGIREVPGTGNLQIGNVTISGIGEIGDVIGGSGNLQINDITILGAGTREVTGTGNLQIGDIGIAGIGSVISVIPGNGNIRINDITISGTGIREVTGTGNLQIGDIAIQGFSLSDVATPPERRGTVAASNRRVEVISSSRRSTVGT